MKELIDFQLHIFLELTSAMAAPPPRSHQPPPPARPPKTSQAPLLDPPALPEAFKPGKGRTSTLTSPPTILSATSEASTLRADERDLKEKSPTLKERDPSSKRRNLKDPNSLRDSLHSPSPPPPPSLTSLGEQEEFPPPPSYSTLKRLTSYRR